MMKKNYIARVVYKDGSRQTVARRYGFACEVVDELITLAMEAVKEWEGYSWYVCDTAAVEWWEGYNR